MRRMPLAGVGVAIQSVDTPPFHQGGDTATPDWMPRPLEHLAQHPGPSARVRHMPCVDPAHQRHLVWRHRGRLGVRGRARQLQKLALPDTWPCVGSVNHRVALSKPALVSAPSQQSCSSVSGPSLAWRPLSSGSAALARQRHPRRQPSIAASILKSGSDAPQRVQPTPPVSCRLKSRPRPLGP